MFGFFLKQRPSNFLFSGTLDGEADTRGRDEMSVNEDFLNRKNIFLLTHTQYTPTTVVKGAKHKWEFFSSSAAIKSGRKEGKRS